jgi:pectate lyase
VRSVTKSSIWCFVLLACTIANSFGATYHVRASATGTANGSDWINAYPALPTTLSRGSTYYVATGTYGGYTFNTSESGTTVVTVKKATGLDHGNNTGWNDSYGIGTAVFTNYWLITRGYFILDGQVGGGPGSWTNGYGFKIQSLSKTSFRSGIEISGNRKYVTLRHLEIEGNGGDGDGGGGGPANDALSIGIGTDYTTVSYAYLHDAGRCLIFGHGDNMFFEFVYGGKFESTGVEHAEIASLWASIPPVAICTNVTFANCVWSHMEGTGGLIMYADGVKVYGNVFYRPAGVTFPPANGALATWSNPGSIFTRGRIYNNSFINLGANFPALGLGFGLTTSDNFVMNNIFYNCRVDFGGVTLHDYNLFISTSGSGATSEAHGATATSAIFNDYNALDFTLKNNTGAGTNVGSPYHLDANGNPRTTWTRGAYEYGSGLNGVALKIQRTGNQFLFSWPGAAPNYKLCAATNATPTTTWLILTNTPMLSNGQWTVSLPASAAQRQFFRLQKF